MIGRMRPDRPGRRPHTVAPVVVGTAVAAVLAWSYAWWAVGRQPFSGAATVAVTLPGAAAAAAGLAWARAVGRRSPERTGGAGAAMAGRAPPEPRRRPPPALAGLWRWAALAALAAAWQLGAYLQHPRHDHPTLSSLTNAALDSQGARAAGFLAWLAVTVALVRR